MALALSAPPSTPPVMPPTRSASLRIRTSPSAPAAPASFPSSTLPTPPSARRPPRPDCRILLSPDFPSIDISPAALRSHTTDPNDDDDDDDDDAHGPHSPAHIPLFRSPAEESDGDDLLSPIVFRPNEEYEKARLSLFGPRPPLDLRLTLPALPSARPGPSSASSPSPSPWSPPPASPSSPVVFSHPNLSSPTLESLPLLAPQSLGARLNRPLPPLPKAVTSPVHASAHPTRSPHPSPVPALAAPPLFRPGSEATDTHPDRRAGPRRRTDAERGGARSGAGSRTASPSSSPSDTDSGAAAFSPSPSTSSPCTPATSTYTTASSDVAPSDDWSLSSTDARPHARTLPPAPRPHTKPIHLALTIPARAQSAPLPQTRAPHERDRGTAPTAAPAFGSPCISVTPASPAPHSSFPPRAPRWTRKKTRTASATSIVLPSDDEGASCPRGVVLPAERPRPRSGCDERTPSPALDGPAAHARAPSPAPSLTPSTASVRSTGKLLSSTAKSTLRRIASRTRLFGRRTRSSANACAGSDESTRCGSDDGANEEEEETVVGHSSLSLDGQTQRPRLPARARSESPVWHTGTPPARPAKVSAESAPGDLQRGGAGERRVEIAEVTVTAGGEVWEARELEDVIPILRQLKAPARFRL